MLGLLDVACKGAVATRRAGADLQAACAGDRIEARMLGSVDTEVSPAGKPRRRFQEGGAAK